jgi:pyruvate dehydrogenase E2 component (dihydrolipoamide acetyltransferase)
MIKEIKLPEIADNVTTAVVLEIQVSVGDKIEKDGTLAEMESDKATFELPSDTSGTVKEIRVSTGDEVSVGQVMFAIDDSAPDDDEDGNEPAEEEKKRKKNRHMKKPGQRTKRK